MNTPFQTVIVDDDQFSQEVIKDLLQSHFADYRVAATFFYVKEAVKTLPSIQPDLVFLDIELPDGKGFDVLEQLDKIDFEVIITTMHNSYMLQAIQHSAIDYVMKPITRNNLQEALERFEKKVAEAKKKSAPPDRVPRISKLALPTQEGLVLIEVADIIRLESEGAYTRFMTSGGESYMTSKSIGSYEDQLTQDSFFRVHHGHLINLRHIKRYIKGEGGYVVMSDNSTVDVSRRKKEEFLKALGL